MIKCTSAMILALQPAYVRGVSVQQTQTRCAQSPTGKSGKQKQRDIYANGIHHIHGKPDQVVHNASEGQAALSQSLWSFGACGVELSPKLLIKSGLVSET